MTVAIKKEDLIPALDNGQVRFHAEGDLTPADVDELLRKNADRLADSSGKSDVNVESLFDHDGAVKITTHKEKVLGSQSCKTRC